MGLSCLIRQQTKVVSHDWTSRSTSSLGSDSPPVALTGVVALDGASISRSDVPSFLSARCRTSHANGQRTRFAEVRQRARTWNLPLGCDVLSVTKNVEMIMKAISAALAALAIYATALSAQALLDDASKPIHKIETTVDE